MCEREECDVPTKEGETMDLSKVKEPEWYDIEGTKVCIHRLKKLAVPGVIAERPGMTSKEYDTILKEKGWAKVEV